MGANVLACCLPVSSADNLCKQFRRRPGPTKCQPYLDTLLVYLREAFSFEKKNWKKKSDDKKS